MLVELGLAVTQAVTRMFIYGCQQDAKLNDRAITTKGFTQFTNVKQDKTS